MINNEKLHISLRGCLKFNNKNLEKLSSTDRQALEKIFKLIKFFIIIHRIIPYLYF